MIDLPAELWRWLDSLWELSLYAVIGWGSHVVFSGSSFVFTPLIAGVAVYYASRRWVLPRFRRLLTRWRRHSPEYVEFTGWEESSA